MTDDLKAAVKDLLLALDDSNLSDRCGVCTGHSPSWDGHLRNCKGGAVERLRTILDARPAVDVERGHAPLEGFHAGDDLESRLGVLVGEFGACAVQEALLTDAPPVDVEAHTEWGVEWFRGADVIPLGHEAQARRYASTDPDLALVMRREVTDWLINPVQDEVADERREAAFQKHRHEVLAREDDPDDEQAQVTDHGNVNGGVPVSMADVLRKHQLTVDRQHCTGCDWSPVASVSYGLPYVQHAQHQEDMLRGASLLADPDALTRVKAEAWREAADLLESDGRVLLKNTAGVLRASADRIDPTEGGERCTNCKKISGHYHGYPCDDPCKHISKGSPTERTRG